jgi:antitoxin component of RelBE/YafQ-DinJ toxin-antitoxin module
MKEEKKYLMLALDDSLKQELIDEAKEKGLTLSAYVRMILIERNK